MIKGIIEQRAEPRAPFESDIQIRFLKDNTTIVYGKTVDISAGGLQFAVPWGTELFHPGAVIEIVFKELPFIGDMTVASEIKHERAGIDNDYQRLIYFGAKFLNLSLNAWNAIMDFIQAKSAPPPPSSIPKKETVERKDIRVATCLNAEIQLSDNPSSPIIIEDISYGGVKIRTPKSIAVNEPLTLILDTRNGPLEIQGSCAWFNLDTDNQFVAGIFFNKLSLDEYNALREIIFSVRQSGN